MRKYRTPAWVLAIGLFLHLLGGLAAADLYYECEQVSRNVPGRRDGTAVLKQYFSADAVALDLGDRIAIMRFREKIYYDLDKARKTYTTGPLERMSLESVGIETQGAEQNPLLNSVMQAVVQSAVVTPTREQRQIGAYTCRKYWVRVFVQEAAYWTSKGVEGFDELRAIADRSLPIFMCNPLLQRLNILGLIHELDGYPVLTVTYLMGGTITSTLTKTERTKLNPAIFQVPPEYRLVPNP